MANGFFNNQVMTPTSGCGAPGPLPGVAVFQPEVNCPGTGFGANTFVSPATPLGVGLTTPIAKFIVSSTAELNVFFGHMDAACITFIQQNLGIEVQEICDVATKNLQANQLCCFWDAFQQTVIGVVAKTNGALDSLSATQVLFQPCNPCFTSDTDFLCTNGCNNNSNFLLTNAVAGGPAAVIVNVPANTPITFEICTCAPQVNSFAGCPTAVPVVAQIANGPACPPGAPLATVNGGVINGINGTAMSAAQRFANGY